MRAQDYEMRRIADITSRFPVLTAEQEVEVAQKVAEGDKQAWDLLICSNYRLVLKEVNRQMSKIEDSPILTWGDLVSYGIEGVIRAAQKFDYKKGYKFSTYSTYWIRQHIDRRVAETHTSIRVPIHIVEKIGKIRKAQAAYFKAHSKVPTLQQTADILEMTVEQVETILSYKQKPISLDMTPGRDDHKEITLVEIISDGKDIWEDIEQSDLRKTILNATYSMTPIEQKAFLFKRGLIDGDHHTNKEVAEYVKTSEVKVRTMLSRATRKLKISLKRKGWEDAPNDVEEKKSNPFAVVASICKVIEQMQRERTVWTPEEIATRADAPQDWLERYSVCKARYEEARRVAA
jgi:RNA polymerase primary sigma factor